MSIPDWVNLFANREMLSYFAWGAIMMACLASSLFFFRFWKQTGDRLFIIFGISFLLLGAERLILAIYNIRNEATGYIFIFRLLAFILIIVAIIDKNMDKKIK